MNSLSVQEAQSLLRRVRREARRMSSARFRWGCVLETGEAADGSQCWVITTKGGERLPLTIGMLYTAGGIHFWLQGRTPALLTPWGPGERTDESLAGDIHLELFHAPRMGPRAPDLGLITVGQLVLGMTRPAVLLCAHRPTSWPP